jgi:hypothetical protein
MSNQVLLELAAKIAFVRERKTLYIEFSQSGYLPLHLQTLVAWCVVCPRTRDLALITACGGAMIAAMPGTKNGAGGLGGYSCRPSAGVRALCCAIQMESNIKLKSRSSFEEKNIPS